MEKISELLSKNLKKSISTARNSYQEAKKKEKVIFTKDPLPLILFDTKQAMEVFLTLSFTQTPLHIWAEAYLEVTGNQPSEIYFKVPCTMSRANPKNNHDFCPERVWEDGIKGLETCKVCFNTGRAILLDKGEIIYDKERELYGRYRTKDCWCGFAPKEG